MHIPPCTGDEGIAVGCAYFGLEMYQQHHSHNARSGTSASSLRLPSHGMSPYQGIGYSRDDVSDAIDEFSTYVHEYTARKATPLAEEENDGCDGAASARGGPDSDVAQRPRRDQLATADLLALAVREIQECACARGEMPPADEDLHAQTAVVVSTALALERGEVVAWFQGRAEFGPRALGHRSLLADPRNAQLRDDINKFVKRREAFRPFAPAVLDEHAHEWFEGINEDICISP